MTNILQGEEQDYSFPPVFKKWIAEGKMTEQEAEKMIENARLIDKLGEDWKDEDEDEDEKDDKYFGFKD